MENSGEQWGPPWQGTLDVANFMSTDEKFGSGMYKSGKIHTEDFTQIWVSYDESGLE